MEKDARHKELVEEAGGEFLPLVVDNFGVWTPSSIEILRSSLGLPLCVMDYLPARCFVILLSD